jgi:cyclin-dependent kinase-like
MNKYEILNLIGEGAYGTVLKSLNKETNEIVAIKKFKGPEDDEASKKSVMRELKILRQLKHDNIVQFKEAFKRKGLLYLVLEFVDRNLLQVLEYSQDGLEEELVRKYMFQLCLALDHCHKQGIVHRDIKPENLLISNTQKLKLCDFGFARNLTKEPMTDYVATRWYRSPELLLGTSYGKEVDVWAAGCIMGEITDGQPLFPGDNEIDQLYVIQKVLGSLTTDQKHAFESNPRFSNVKFPDISSYETLERRFSYKLSTKALKFLKSLLCINPSERITIKQAINHEYFDGIRKNHSQDRPSTSLIKQEQIYRNNSRNSRPNIPLQSHLSHNSTPSDTRRTSFKFKESLSSVSSKDPVKIPKSFENEAYAQGMSSNHPSETILDHHITFNIKKNDSQMFQISEEPESKGTKGNIKRYHGSDIKIEAFKPYLSSNKVKIKQSFDEQIEICKE